MFGLGSKDTAVIAYVEKAFLPLGFSPTDANQFASAMIAEVKAELAATSPGTDPYTTALGKIRSEDPSYLKPRIEAGLTAEDVRAYWSRYLIQVLCDQKIRVMLKVIALNLAEQQGRNLKEFSDHYDKTNPQYGDPAKSRTRLYEELAPRSALWREKTADEELDKLIAIHGSFNNMVRALIAQKLI